MNLVLRDPFWKDFNTLSGRINRMLSEFPRDDESDFLGNFRPSVDVYDKGTEIVVHAEIPGIKKEDIDVRVENNVLTIRGKKERKEEVKEEGFYRAERAYGSFSRSFSLPTTVDISKISAAYNDGVLTLRVPKSEAAKPRQIEVKVS
ncbi:MAG TPA: Hsp20/alpha crystallin family protein [Vicinamibacteria bacterium]|nr:Hsp20/alpha crystallin family protein [Vicinamibacteria bacterium]